MVLFIKKLFGAIFGLFAALGKLLGLGKKGEFYVELEAAPATAAAPAVEATPETTVTAPPPEPTATVPPVVEAPTPAPVAPTPTVPYAQFPRRRRPGANMASFLTMARQVRPST
ncbi:hypothetical protein RYO59_001335 [Thermosynechococcaceae cyanobacterium Okahandja]